MSDCIIVPGRNRDTDTENGYVETEKEGEGGMKREIRIDMMPIAQGAQLSSL